MSLEKVNVNWFICNFNGVACLPVKGAVDVFCLMKNLCSSALSRRSEGEKGHYRN